MPVGPYRRSEQRRCAFRREIAAAPTLQGAAGDLTDVLRVSKSFRTRLRNRRWSFSTQAGGFAPLHSARRVRQDPTRRRSRNHQRHEREYRHPYHPGRSGMRRGFAVVRRILVLATISSSAETVAATLKVGRRSPLGPVSIGFLRGMRKSVYTAPPACQFARTEGS